jgi:hypothetical protein
LHSFWKQSLRQDSGHRIAHRQLLGFQNHVRLATKLSGSATRLYWQTLIRIGFQQTIDEYLSSQDGININDKTLFFGLIEPPSANLKYQVQVTIELNTGEIYSRESTTVEFIN